MVVPDQHTPVLLEEALAALQIVPDGCYVDGTFGRGGHAAAILQRLSVRGRLFALDKDASAVRCGRQRFATDPRFSMEQGSFASLEVFARRHDIVGAVNGLLLDLGVSSPQLDDAARGFSFTADGPLDMRMDQRGELTAARWLAHAAEQEIATVLHDYGDERFARRIARAIVNARERQPIASTRQLADIVAAASPRHERGKHPATRSFQAIRIFINRELDDLRAGLDQALRILAAGARLVVISFHSLEDRIVKRFLRDAAQGPKLPKGLPVPHRDTQGVLRVIGKALRPGAAEIAANPRARSAVMRVAERLA